MFTFLLYSEVRIEGLETLDYLDNLSQRQLLTEQGDAITFESEVNLNKILQLSIVNKYLCSVTSYQKFLLIHVSDGPDIP
jgi:hypothetical protein